MSELCRSIGPHMIPLLPTLLPTVLKHLGGPYEKARYVHVCTWTIDTRVNVLIVTLKRDDLGEIPNPRHMLLHALLS